MKSQATCRFLQLKGVWSHCSLQCLDQILVLLKIFLEYTYPEEADKENSLCCELHCFSKVVKLLWECGLKNEIIIECLLWGNTVCCVCLVTQSCLTLCDPMDCSPPGSSVRGILQTRILEWVTMPSSRGSSQPRD